MINLTGMKSQPNMRDGFRLIHDGARQVRFLPRNDHRPHRAIRAMAELGCETLLQTNAAGSLRFDMPPGSLMAITDHINFTGVNPLFGLGGGDNRFVDMVNSYDPALTQRLLAAAKAANILCHDGVYIWFCGPSFETPAEIRAAKILGADLVGMSTVPEVILARLYGLRCLAVSMVTNFGAGLAGGDPSHAETKEVANEGSALFRQLLRAFIKAYDAAKTDAS